MPAGVNRGPPDYNGLLFGNRQSMQMQVSGAKSAVVFLAAAIILAGCATGESTARVTEVARSAESRPIDAPAADFRGRQLYGAPHAMNPAMMQELRQNVPKFADISHDEIMRFMSAMGPNYTWYVSPEGPTGRYGVLVLAHGFGQVGDGKVGLRLQPIARQYPTAMAMGMSMMTSDHIQLAMNNLAARGVEDIIVVPVVSTRYNTMLRQWDYIFGLREEAEYASVPRAAPPANLHIVPPLEDDPLVGDALLDYAAEISTNPAQEDVIIVAHGPLFEDDNRAQLAMLERIAAYMNERSEYASITVATLQDDAVKEVRDANVADLRERVRRSTADGRDVLIITNLLGTRTVQSGLRRDLRGLDYKFNSKGLVEHDNFVRWVEKSVAGVTATLQ